MRFAKILALLVGATVVASPGAGDAADGWQVVGSMPVAEGVEVRELVRGDPVRGWVVQVAAGAPAHHAVVVSSDRIGGGRETVSSMCRRVGAVACVNASFATCPRCGQPGGAVVRDGILLRTPAEAGRDEVSVIDGRFTTDPWAWSVRLESAGFPALQPPGRLDLQGVNIAPRRDGIVLYTRDHGPRTPAPEGLYEVVVRAPQPLRTGSDVRQPAELRARHVGGAAPIPIDGVVLSGHGAGAERLRRFVDRYHRWPIELVTDTPDGLHQTVAGHPVLLRDGQRQPLDSRGGRHLVRHPRTVVGWDRHGSLWLLVVDGRRPGSRGVGLADAAATLQALGATDAVNLDGGGSSTLVARCPLSSASCVYNHPSDGSERRVTTALAVHGALLPAPPPPPAPPAPPPPPAPAPEAAPAAATAVAADLSTTAGPAPAPAPAPPPTAAPATTVASAGAASASAARPSADASPDGIAAGAARSTTAPRPGRAAIAVLAGLMIVGQGLGLARLHRVSVRRRAPPAPAAQL